MLQTDRILILYAVLGIGVSTTAIVLGLSALENKGLVDIQIGPYLIHVESKDDEPT